MKKLEKKIINKIYRMETKKTISQIFVEAFSVVFVGLSALFVFSIIIDILNEQRSFDLYNFLTDDFEVIRHFFLRNTILFSEELPLALVCILVLLVVAFILLIYIIVKNFHKITNKLVSIYKFWFK